MDELVAKAAAEYQQNPTSGPALKQLVELLCRRERPDEETRAIGLLINEFKRSGEYRWKQSADEIRIKQLGRDVREAEKAGDANFLKEAQIAQLRFELSVFKDRVERYPSDHRARFEYGVRKFRAGQFDDAIPLLQTARNDPKNRAACGMYLGRCFFRKGYHSQAVTALQEAIAEYEFPDDELGKTMRYWLARSQEAAGDREGAGRTYGEILTMDYNYKDVRARLDQVTARG
jgi:tetratricopeptide (TPR) repeat protein